MFRRHLKSALLLATLATAHAAPPAWWASSGATDGATANDYASVTQGQLKQFTSMAVREMDKTGTVTKGLGGAGTELNALINNWNANKTPEADKVVMNVGQLKWIAAKIHSRLQYIGWCDTTPSWITLDPDNQSVANLGQLKSVFAFDPYAADPNSDYDHDGLTNAQEMGSTPATSYTNADTDGDGIPDGEDTTPTTFTPPPTTGITASTLNVWNPAEM